MLVSLHVKNLALIDETECFFGEGMNILTGETGAGKSLIIGSVNLALGGKADKDLIRTGADYALVELVFQTMDERVASKMTELDIPTEADGTIVISRRLQASRSVARINGETVTARQIKELAELLIDIHGQHEHQSLLHKKKHMEILDAYAGEEMSLMLDKLRTRYEEYQAVSNRILQDSMDDTAKRRELELAEFELQEIDAAALIPGEDEILEHTYSRMLNSRKITEAVTASYQQTGYDAQNGAGSQIGRALRELKMVSAIDEDLQELEIQLFDIDNLLNDYNRAMAEYMNHIEFEPQDFADTEERLNRINRLKEKYGNTISDILAYKEEKQKQIEKISDYDSYMLDLKQQQEKAAKDVDELCACISAIRQKNASILADKMKCALEEMNFISVAFEIQVRKKEIPRADGYDEVEFVISTNPGEALKPLGQVASGGELSRIMLALKTVLAGRDGIETLIFDEIDAGISGKTAWKISEKLGVLSRGHQIICITHLPQIAAMADNHYCIRKSSDGISTITTLQKLDRTDSIQELARLLGGEVITDVVLQNAEEMKKMADEGKNYQTTSKNGETIILD